MGLGLVNEAFEQTIKESKIMKVLQIKAIDKLTNKFRNLSPSTAYVPEWYRKSNSVMNGRGNFLIFKNPKSTTSTYKKCTPFLEAMIDGYMVHLISDVEVTTTEEGYPYLLTRSEKQAVLAFHPEPQWSGLHVPHGYHQAVFKFENNFMYTTPSGYSTLFTHPLNRFDLPFQTIAGFVDTDKFDLPVNFPFFLKEGFQGIIEAGTPIAQLHMIKRENWEREYLEPKEEDVTYAAEKLLTRIKRTYKYQHWTKKEYK